MKKVIAIVITVIYLCFTTGALIRANLDILSYETLVDGRSNENSETETSKGVEVFHIHAATKSWQGLKFQTNRQSIVKANAPLLESYEQKNQLTSYNKHFDTDHPLFLKNRVFRL